MNTFLSYNTVVGIGGLASGWDERHYCAILKGTGVKEEVNLSCTMKEESEEREFQAKEQPQKRL